MPHDLFISYSARDKTVADTVCSRLEAMGIRCWIAPRDVSPGADWSESIVTAIEDCRIFVLIFSNNANESVQTKRELERAVSEGHTIIPFRVEDIPPSKSLSYFISTSHWLDAISPPLERHIERLGSVVHGILGEHPPNRNLEVTAEPNQGERQQPKRKTTLVVAVTLVLALGAILIVSGQKIFNESHSDRTETKKREMAESGMFSPPDVDLHKLDSPPDLNMATSLANLARLYEAQGRFKEASEIWTKVLSMRGELLGARHPLYAETLESMVRLYVRMGTPKSAEELQVEALSINEEAFGPEHPVTAGSLNLLAMIYLETAEYSKAALLIERALRILTRSFGPAHPDMVPILENLLRVYNGAGNYEKASEVARQLEELRTQFGLSAIRWIGEWVFSQQTTSGESGGRMSLEQRDESTVEGKCFDDQFGESSLIGSITEDGNVLNGTWKNKKTGQSGNLHLELSEDSMTFSGNFAVGDKAIDDSINWWIGRRLR
jgi:tetratricopeptide (TPR) repeat protein